VSYCDFCGQDKRTKAIETCRVCQADICSNHRNLVPVKKEAPFKHPREDRFRQIWVLLDYDFRPVCPDCSFQSFFDLLTRLSDRSIALVGNTAG
jgi:hypothetical protein